jgi:hypothetical protein
MNRDRTRQASARHRRPARAVAVALVLGASALSAGCASVGTMFDSSEPAPKPAVRKVVAPKPKVGVTPAMRAEAEAMRNTALQQMSRGAVGPAVSTLTKASKLDPTNEQIRRDLDQAIRVRGSVASLPQSEAQSRVD